MKQRLGLAAAVLTLAVRPSYAGLPDESVKTLPCRPTIACTADIVAPGAFELEAGFNQNRLGGGVRQWSFPFLAKLTLERWLQVQVGSNAYTTARGAPANYFDNLVVGPKLHFLDQTDVLPALALSAQASIPTVAAEGYVRNYGGVFIGYVTKDFGPVHADFNAGMTAWRLDDTPLAQPFVALALSMGLPPPFGVLAESYYFADAAPAAGRDGGLRFALTHSPRPWLTFDAGGDVGFFPSTRAYSVFIGMSIVPVLL